jgi:endonuclease/exonuclease/phosphatase family metal-dependent hydrolase
MKIFYLLFLVNLCSIAQINKLKIVTINVWTGLDFQGTFKIGEYEPDERREARFSLLLEQLKIIKPDIIFLQEANPVSKYSSRLADSLDFDEIHQVCNAGIKLGPVGIPVNLKYGNVILANKNLQLQYFDTRKLGGGFGLFGDAAAFHFNESNFALVGKILVGNTPVYVINVHLSDVVPEDSVLKSEFETYCKENLITEKEIKDIYLEWDNNIERRNYELENIKEYLTSLPSNIPLIIGGDFNTEPQIKELGSLIESNGLLDTHIKEFSADNYTWDPSNNENISYSTQNVDAEGKKLHGYNLLSTVYDLHPRRIDYIFLSKHFQKEDILSYKTVFSLGKNNINASDHFGVCSEVDLIRILNSAPKESDEINSQEDNTIEVLPIASYDTDAGFGYGAKAFLLNLLKKNESFDLTLFNSTRGERWYRFVFSVPDFELRQQKIYPFAVDLTVDYDKYIKNNFFGVGNKSSRTDKEIYTKEPLELGLNFGRGFTKNIITQLGLKYKTVKNYNYSDSSKLLHTGSLLSSSKVKFISFNFAFRYDTRNSFLNPSSGLVLSTEAEYSPLTGFTNVSFSRYAGWVQYYSTLGYPKITLALKTGMQFLTGEDLPVQVLIPIGGNNTLRGFPQDRFLDKISAIFNAELRIPVYWRFGVILGIDAGKVWHSAEEIDLKNWAYNPVAGLRFHMYTFIIRLDIGISKESAGIYLNFGQIF